MLLLLIFTLICCSNSTSYYFSSTLGNDNNSGTSSSSPWKSLSKASNLNLKPGDSILLRANNTFTNEQLLIKDAYGTSKNPITVSSYDLNSLYNRARISLKGNTDPNINTTILCINCNGIIFSALELCDTTRNGISLIYSNSRITSLDYIVIENNYFHNMHTPNPANTGGEGSWAAAVNISGFQSGIKLTNYILKNNLVNATDTFTTSQKYSTHNIQILSGEMSGNLITHNSYNVVILGGIENYIVERNVFLNNTPITEFVYGTTDIIIGTLDSSSMIINNEFGYRGEWSTGPDGCAIDFETDPNGTIVRENYIYNSWGAGIMIYGHPPTKLPQNINIVDNIFVQDGCIQDRNDRGAIAFMRANTSGVVSNNYFVRCENSSVPIYNTNGQNGYLNNWKLVNNTIVNTTAHIVDKPILYFNEQVVDESVSGQQKVVLVSAKCGGNVVGKCDIRYTIDGSKPIRNSTKYNIGQDIMVVRTSGILFKAFVEGMIESQVTGCILNPEKKGKAGCDVM